MNETPKTTHQAKRSFEWGIASTDISFLHGSEATGARDGSVQNCNDCSSYVSPLPRPQREGTDDVREGK